MDRLVPDLADIRLDKTRVAGRQEALWMAPTEVDVERP